MSIVVANALWLPSGDRRTPNLWGVLKESPAAIYLKNSYCSLASVRRFHPEATLILVHDGTIEDPFRQRFEQLGVRLVPLKFERYTVPDDYPWKGGYYKLDALSWLAENFERFLLLDTDTICVAPLDEVFHAARDRVLLYQVHHRESQRSRVIINSFAQHVDGKEHCADHLGGEAVALDRSVASAWLAACQRVYQNLATRWDFFHGDNPDQGDELILSLAAEAQPQLVSWMNPYLTRFWTVEGVAGLSTRHEINPVEIWHLPVEKKAGILSLYERLTRTGRWPLRGDLIRLLHLEQGWGSGVGWFLRKLKRRLLGRGKS